MKIVNIVLAMSLVLGLFAATACLPRPTTSTTTTPTSSPTTTVKPTTTPTSSPTTTVSPTTTPTSSPTTTVPPTTTPTSSPTTTVPPTTTPTSSPTTTAISISRKIEFSAPPSSLEIYTGDKFVFYIESNPSTGYTWQTAPGIDENVVKLSGEESIPASTPTPGAPGQEKFTFTATGNGQATITLNYIRPWETDTAPAETWVINVIVSPNGTSKKIESDIPPSSLEIYSGDKFVFYIESNPSTGYTWQMASGIDENVVELSSQETIPAPATTPNPVVGAPGQEKFTFTATGKGLATITLNYVRPWETDAAPANTRVINVKVK